MNTYRLYERARLYDCKVGDIIRIISIWEHDSEFKKWCNPKHTQYDHLHNDTFVVVDSLGGLGYYKGEKMVYEFSLLFNAEVEIVG